jgi:hypothetical protein
MRGVPMSIPTQTDLYFDLKEYFPNLSNETRLELAMFFHGKIMEAYESGMEDGKEGENGY